MFWPEPVADVADTVMLNVPAGVVGAPGMAGAGLLTQPAHVTTRSKSSSTGSARLSCDCGIQRRSRTKRAMVPTHKAANGAGGTGPVPNGRRPATMDGLQLVSTVTVTVGTVVPPSTSELGLTEHCVFGAEDVQVRFSTTTRPGVPVTPTE